MRRPTLSPTAYRRITLLALALLGIIVLTGAGVRLTGSGLGCSTWPSCEPDSFVPHEESGIHGTIESTNRYFTGLVSVGVVLAVAGSFFRVPRRRDLTWWSWTLVAGVVGQVVLGGLTVLFELSPPFVMGHFLLSAVLVACAVVLHHRSGEPDDGERRPVATPEVRLLTRLLVVASGVVLVTGTVVTGTGPHGGDEDVARLDLFLPDVVRVHSIAVWLLLAGTLWTLHLVRRGGASPTVERALRALVVVEVAQGAIGYVQYFSGVPVGLVAAHIAGSMLVLGAALTALLRTSVVERSGR
ncbi:MAG TPA: COX15/CtaA family protein, partial [Acidimicrobiales bacterium]|nr:COX15/CtaA family protein [Acidimicrobiales bacterium]